MKDNLFSWFKDFVFVAFIALAFVLIIDAFAIWVFWALLAVIIPLVLFGLKALDSSIEFISTGTVIAVVAWLLGFFLLSVIGCFMQYGPLGMAYVVLWVVIAIMFAKEQQAEEKTDGLDKKPV